MSGGASQDVAIRGNTVTRIIIHVVLFLFALYYLLPLWVMLVNSVKPLDEIRGGNMIALAREAEVESVEQALTAAGARRVVTTVVEPKQN